MGLEGAHAYLAKVLAWDGKHYASIHEKTRFGLPGRPFKNLNQMIGRLEWLVKAGRANDIYICLATQSATDTKPGTTGDYAVARRLRENAAFLKSIFFDIDVKPDKPDSAYASTDEAMDALYAFLGAVGMPEPSVIVSSGTGGLHSYWTFTDPLPVDMWQRLSNALSAAAKAHGLKFDSQCTVDAVRVLRVPDTFNAKTNPPSPVRLEAIKDTDYFVDKIEACLAPFITAGPAIIPALPPTNSKSNLNDELTGGIAAKGVVPRDINAVANVCPFIAHTLATAGRENSQPLWFHSLGIAAYCIDGENVAHQLSSGHAGYHPDETKQEYDRIKRDHDLRPQLGLTSCEAIAKAGCIQCATCPHISTPKARPISLTPISVTAAATANPGDTLPNGYIRNANNGFIYREEIDDKGNKKHALVMGYKIWNAWISVNPFQLHFTRSTTGDGTRICTIPVEAIGNSQSLHTAFARNAMVLQVTPGVMHFMISFVAELQRNKATVSSAQAFGWSVEENAVAVDGFIYNGTRYTPQGQRPAAAPDPNLAKQYTPRGELQPWLDVASFISNQGRSDLDTLLTVGFAAPLMKFSGHPGMTLGGWSSASGVGKTTSLMASQAIWSAPRSHLGLDDTQISVARKASQIRNLPLLWDEIRDDAAAKAFSNLLFKVASGKEKSRSRRDGSLAEQGSWETLLAYGSNYSMVDVVAESNRSTTSGAMRLFEFECIAVPSTVPSAVVTAMVSKLDYNYGRAGEIYSKFLGENVQTVAEAVDKLALQLTVMLKTPQAYRFWTATMACLLLGAKYGNQLGLTKVNTDKMLAFLLREYRRMAKDDANAGNDFSKPSNVVSVLSEFLAEKRVRNTVQTNTVFVGHHRPMTGEIRVVSDAKDQDRIDVVQVQITQDHKLRIAEAALNAWLKERNIPRTAMATAMADLLGAGIIRARLASGTRFSRGIEAVWAFEATATNGLLDGIAWPSA